MKLSRYVDLHENRVFATIVAVGLWGALLCQAALAAKPKTAAEPAAAKSAAASNLVFNPSFEIHEPSGPAGWKLDGKMSTHSNEQAREGKWSLKVVDASTTEGSSARSQPIPVVAGMTYTARAWSHVQSGGGIGLYVEFLDAAKKKVPATPDPLVKSMPDTQGRWRRSELTFTVPAQARACQIHFHSYSASQVTVYIDDVALSPGGSIDPEAAQAVVRKPFVKLPIRLAGDMHPRAVIRRDEVDAILEKTKEQPWAKAAYDVLIREADRWKSRTIEIPDRGGQWPHWYACAVDGYKLTAKSPTEHRCTKCGKIYSGEPYDSVYINSQHGELARAALSLGLAFVFRGDEAYARKVQEILLGYSQRYENYPLHDIHGNAGKGGRVGSQTLDEAMWLIPIAQAYDCIAGAESWTPAQRGQVEQHLLRPAADVIRRVDLGASNIQAWHNAAVGAVGLCLRDRDLVDEAINGKSGFQFQMQNSIQDDGLWYEGAWGYHFFALMPLTTLAEMATRSGIPLFDNRRFRTLFDAPLEFMMPNGRLPAFHDSQEVPAAQPDLYESAFTHWADVNFSGAVRPGGRKSIRSLLYGVATLPEAAAPQLSSRNFTPTGFAVLRTGGDPQSLYLALDYGPHGGGHGHPDKLSFVFYGLGQVLALDPGCVAYGLKVQQSWYRQTLAHNTLVIDECSQNPCTGKCRQFAAAPGIRVVEATADSAYEGVEMSRMVALTDRYALILDRLSSDVPHTMDWVYHNYGDLTLGDGLRMEAQAAPLGSIDGYQHVTSIARATTGEAWNATWRVGDKSVRLAMLDAPATEVIRGVGLGTKPSEPVPMIIARRKTAATTYAALLVPGAGESEIKSFRRLPANNQATAVEVCHGGATDLVILAARDGVKPIEVSRDGTKIVSNSPLAFLTGTPGGLACLCVAGRGISLASLEIVLDRPSTLYVHSRAGRVFVEHQGDQSRRLKLSTTWLKDTTDRPVVYRLDDQGQRQQPVECRSEGKSLSFTLEPRVKVEVGGKSGQ